MKSKAAGCGSISTVIYSINLLYISSLIMITIVIIIIIIIITILRFVEDSLPSVAKIVKRVEDHCLSMTSYSLQIPYLDNFLFSTPQREET